MRFALHNFLGVTKDRFLVSAENIDSAKPEAVVKTPGHFAFVVDASGSMWGQLEEVKNFLVKLVTLEEYRDASVLVSVLSFASSGDLVTHAARVPITEFMGANSSALRQVQNLQTRGCTCISQGFKGALDLIKDEMTALVLLSDGYANDASPGAEKRAIDTLVERAKSMKNVFVNTISFGPWSDFNLLSYVANACSGTCFATPTAKEVYDVLHDTTSLLAGQTTPAIEVPMNGADYVVFVSRSAGKIIGGSANLLIRGLRPEDDKTIYRFRKVEEAVYNASNAPVLDGEGVYAFARAKLAEGEFNSAKYALVASRNLTLLQAHAKALVSGDLALLAADLEATVRHGVNPSNVITATYGLPDANQASVIQILGLLSTFSSDVQIDVDALMRAGYRKRSVRRLSGSFNEAGEWVPYPYKQVPVQPSNFVPLSSVDINQDTASVNILTGRPAKLVSASSGADVTESDLDGVRLSLYENRNYTIVGDGSLNAPSLTIRIQNKRLFRALVDAGVLADGNFDANVAYTINLTGRPLVGYATTFSSEMFDGLFAKALRLKVVSSILSACIKGQSDTYTAEQIAKLKSYGVSAGGNFSTPTKYWYETQGMTKDQALTEGVIDTRLSYKVRFGTPEIPNLGELYSANAYLARRFTMTGTDVDPKKPKFEDRWAADVKYGIKALTAKTTLGPVDDEMYPIFLDFLGLDSNGSVGNVLRLAGYSDAAVTAFYEAAQGKVSKDTAVERFTDARKAVAAALDSFYVSAVSPFVFYVGATGLMPDEFNAKAMTGDQVQQKYPKADLGKDADETTYYMVGDTLLSILTKVEYFDTGKVVVANTDDAE